MDWSVTHSLNGLLAAHDAVEDPLLAYVQVSELLFLGMLVVVCALAPHAADASFPSDHATASVAIATAILVRQRHRWGLITLVFAAILCFGRVALGFHYPTDVLGGAALGATAAFVLWLRSIRDRINAVSDRAGAAWDRVTDAALVRARFQPKGD